MGMGESDLRRMCAICRILYSLVIGLGFREEGRENLTFRSCQGGVGGESRVGGRDWARWSEKTLELKDLESFCSDVLYFVFTFLFPACGSLVNYRRVCGDVCAG